jgi:hypothetical protein
MPLHETSITVEAATTTNDAVPTGSEGADCEDFDGCVIYTTTLTSVTAYDIQLWGKIGSDWFILDGGLFETIGANTKGVHIACEELERVFAQILSFAGTSLVKKYKVLRRHHKR